MHVFSIPSPMGSEEDWTKYLDFLGKLDTDDISVLQEIEKAKEIIELIKADSYL